ncbi:hypothetical protein N5P37_010873, partial [Trichoderma harzianum]
TWVGVQAQQHHVVVTLARAAVASRIHSRSRANLHRLFVALSSHHRPSRESRQAAPKDDGLCWGPASLVAVTVLPSSQDISSICWHVRSAAWTGNGAISSLTQAQGHLDSGNGERPPYAGGKQIPTRVKE